MKISSHITVLGAVDSICWESPIKNPRFKKSTKIQSIIFDRKKWNVKEAKAWLKAHSKKIPTVDTTAEYLRFRQESPGSFQKSTFRTIPMGKNGIKSVIAVPKHSKSFKNPTKSTTFKSREFFLCCNSTLTVLYILHGSYAEIIEEPGNISLFGNAYKLWSGFEPTEFYGFDLPEYTLKKSGEVNRLCYQSDKWDGKLTHYYHDFESSPSVWMNRYSDSTIWAIKHKAGKKIVSAEGIIG